MLCICFYVFLNWPGDLKPLGSAGRQADKYIIAPGGKFFMLLQWGTAENFSAGVLPDEFLSTFTNFC